ncbi:AbrB/MazE/SpoVT family DNA-binding domain-containing protein [Halorubraceae archaeon YAN]|nr:AbrB/MazE/SpoVT family DNA-binding domain-containing protein [Halorubraceae archaeon YAN]
MSKTENNNGSEIVSVSKHGQATIPKRFREKLGIDAPGRVRFRNKEDEVVVERVPEPKDMQGLLANRDASTDKPASKLLHQHRDKDRNERSQHFDTDE